ncbi:MAG: hypothetical protein KDE47_31870 [Caldilineaceae bacterium]|nr:hypothetical protein [Caldilineaceae bacterium]MCB9150188.1 hypothetical protein [Caldilineaceae bacterium]
MDPFELISDNKKKPHPTSAPFPWPTFFGIIGVAFLILLFALFSSGVLWMPITIELPASPTPTPTPNIFSLKRDAVSIDYEELARYTYGHAGENITLKGKVRQVIENRFSNNMLRVDMTNDNGFWSDTILVEYDSYQTFLEDDIVTIFGHVEGKVTYETILGAQKTVPKITAYEIKLER